MWGEERKRKERPFFHIYAVTMFVKHQGIGNEFMHEFVAFDMQTHMEVKVYQSVQSHLGCEFENVTALDIIQIALMIIRNVTLRMFFC